MVVCGELFCGEHVVLPDWLTWPLIARAPLLFTLLFSLAFLCPRFPAKLLSAAGPFWPFSASGPGAVLFKAVCGTMKPRGCVIGYSKNVLSLSKAVEPILGSPYAACASAWSLTEGFPHWRDWVFEEWKTYCWRTGLTADRCRMSPARIRSRLGLRFFGSGVSVVFGHSLVAFGFGPCRNGGFVHCPLLVTSHCHCQILGCEISPRKGVCSGTLKAVFRVSFSFSPASLVLCAQFPQGPLARHCRSSDGSCVQVGPAPSSCFPFFSISLFGFETIPKHEKHINFHVIKIMPSLQKYIGYI